MKNRKSDTSNRNMDMPSKGSQSGDRSLRGNEDIERGSNTRSSGRTDSSSSSHTGSSNPGRGGSRSDSSSSGKR